jgi:uncharacterized membrane protein HdeD (DUF308 family)
VLFFVFFGFLALLNHEVHGSYFSAARVAFVLSFGIALVVTGARAVLSHFLPTLVADQRPKFRLRPLRVLVGALIVFGAGAFAMFLGVRNQTALLAICITTSLVLLLVAGPRTKS